MDSKKLGQLGEQLAEKYLREKGYVILGRNFRQTHGEIDIVALYGEVVVFVEVKTRRQDKFGSGEEAVGETKQKRMLTAAENFLVQNPELAAKSIRFDVVSIMVNDGPENPRVKHFENAVGEE